MKAPVETVGEYKTKTIKVCNIRNEDGKWKAWYGTWIFEKRGMYAYPFTDEYHGAFGDTREEAINNIKEVIDML